MKLDRWLTECKSQQHEKKKAQKPLQSQCLSHLLISTAEMEKDLESVLIFCECHYHCLTLLGKKSYIRYLLLANRKFSSRYLFYISSSAKQILCGCLCFGNSGSVQLFLSNSDGSEIAFSPRWEQWNEGNLGNKCSVAIGLNYCYCKSASSFPCRIKQTIVHLTQPKSISNVCWMGHWSSEGPIRM